MGQSPFEKQLFERNLQMSRLRQEGLSADDIAARLGVDRSTVFRVLGRWGREGARGLSPHSRRPHTSPADPAPGLRAEVLALRRAAGFGADKIRAMLEEQGRWADLPCARVIHRILAEEGLIETRQPRNRRPLVDYHQTLQALRPNHIVGVDVKRDHYLVSRPVAVAGALDMFSRVVVARVATSVTAREAAHLLLDYTERWGAPERVKADNDMRFLGQVEGTNPGLFMRLVLALGATPVFIPVGRPRWNAHIERFFRTWDREFWMRTKWSGWADMVRDHAQFIERYNERRPHDALRRANAQLDLPRPVPRLAHEGGAPGHRVRRLTKRQIADLRRQVQDGRIGLRCGRIEFLRQVHCGQVRFKAHDFDLPDSLEGKIVRGVIDVRPRLTRWPVTLYFRQMEISKSTFTLAPYARGRQEHDLGNE